MPIIGLLALLAVPTVCVAAPPKVAITPASDVGSTTARTGGVLDPQGEDTAYRFEYITDEQFEKNRAADLDGFASASQAGPGFLPATAGSTFLPQVTLDGLIPGVQYHLRLVAENGDGTEISEAPDFFTVNDPEAGNNQIPCVGDACQVLPPEPVDPTLGTVAPGLGNPKVRYRRYGVHRRQKAKRQQGKRKAAQGDKQTEKGARR